MKTTERPILFSGDMVRAILEGRKTMTRRILKWEESELALVDRMIYDPDDRSLYPFYINSNRTLIWGKCPYGKVGDYFRITRTVRPYWMWTKYAVAKTNDPSSAHIQITNIHIERLQDISEEDAIKEGIEEKDGVYGTLAPMEIFNHAPRYALAVQSFKYLHRYKYIEESWDKNPWVWVIEFKRVEQENKNDE